MSDLAFTKMHGLGNDFVVLDARRGDIGLGEERARAISDRRLGIGCDQILVIEPAKNDGADIFLRIFNADGGEVGACGNGTRCAAALIMAETGAGELRIETRAGILAATDAGDGNFSLDMGEVRLDWKDIPLARETDTLHLGIGAGMLADPVGVNVGNPHCVFFVDDVAEAPLEELGPEIETHALFPERANVGVAQILANGQIRLRVWERGVGMTRACGSGACAAVVAAHRRNLAERETIVVLDGGALAIQWREDNHVIMTGPVATSFSGVIDASLLEQAS